MRVLTTEHLIANLALGILNDDAPLCPLHENDESDRGDSHDHQEQDEQGRKSAGAAKFERADQRAGQFRYDTREDD